MERLKRPLLAAILFTGASILPGHPPHVAVAATASPAQERTAVTLKPFDGRTFSLAVAERTPHIEVSRGAPRTRPIPPTPVRRGAISGDVWTRLANCESHGNPLAVGGGGRYFGAFQFTLGSWQRTGRSGNPIDYPYADQLAAAQQLQALSGWGQWPVCARAAGAYA